MSRQQEGVADRREEEGRGGSSDLDLPEPHETVLLLYSWFKYEYEPATVP